MPALAALALITIVAMTTAAVQDGGCPAGKHLAFAGANAYQVAAAQLWAVARASSGAGGFSHAAGAHTTACLACPIGRFTPFRTRDRQKCYGCTNGRSTHAAGATACVALSPAPSPAPTPVPTPVARIVLPIKCSGCIGERLQSGELMGLPCRATTSAGAMGVGERQIFACAPFTNRPEPVQARLGAQMVVFFKGTCPSGYLSCVAKPPNALAMVSTVAMTHDKAGPRGGQRPLGDPTPPALRLRVILGKVPVDVRTGARRRQHRDTKLSTLNLALAAPSWGATGGAPTRFVAQPRPPPPFVFNDQSGTLSLRLHVLAHTREQLHRANLTSAIGVRAIASSRSGCGDGEAPLGASTTSAEWQHVLALPKWAIHAMGQAHKFAVFGLNNGGAAMVRNVQVVVCVRQAITLTPQPLLRPKQAHKPLQEAVAYHPEERVRSIQKIRHPRGRPPPPFGYIDAHATFQVGQPVRDRALRAFGSGFAGSSFSIHPGLPAALSISAWTGEVSGIPLRPMPRHDYMVTMSNRWGRSSTLLSIEIVELDASGKQTDKKAVPTLKHVRSPTPARTHSALERGRALLRRCFQPADVVATRRHLDAAETRKAAILHKVEAMHAQCVNGCHPLASLQTAAVACSDYFGAECRAIAVQQRLMRHITRAALRHEDNTASAQFAYILLRAPPQLNGAPTSGPLWLRAKRCSTSAPAYLTYGTSSINATVGIPIDKLPPMGLNVASQHGGVASLHFSVSPPLPRGLFLSSTTGVISGTPLEKVESEKHTIIAANIFGASRAYMGISVHVALPSPAPSPVPTPMPTQARLLYAHASGSLVNTSNPVVVLAGRHVSLRPQLFAASTALFYALRGATGNTHASDQLPSGIALDRKSGRISGTLDWRKANRDVWRVNIVAQLKNGATLGTLVPFRRVRCPRLALRGADCVVVPTGWPYVDAGVIARPPVLDAGPDASNYWLESPSLFGVVGNGTAAFVRSPVAKPCNHVQLRGLGGCVEGRAADGGSASAVSLACRLHIFRSNTFSRLSQTQNDGQPVYGLRDSLYIFFDSHSRRWHVASQIGDVDGTLLSFAAPKRTGARDTINMGSSMSNKGAFIACVEGDNGKTQSGAVAGVHHIQYCAGAQAGIGAARACPRVTRTVVVQDYAPTPRHKRGKDGVWFENFVPC